MQVIEALREVRDVCFDSEISPHAKQSVKVHWSDGLHSLNVLLPVASLLDIIKQNYANIIGLNIVVFANKLTLNTAVILDMATNLAEVLGLLENLMRLLYAPKAGSQNAKND